MVNHLNTALQNVQFSNVSRFQILTVFFLPKLNLLAQFMKLNFVDCRAAPHQLDVHRRGPVPVCRRQQVRRHVFGPRQHHRLRVPDLHRHTRRHHSQGRGGGFNEVRRSGRPRSDRRVEQRFWFVFPGRERASNNIHDVSDGSRTSNYRQQFHHS